MAGNSESLDKLETELETYVRGKLRDIDAQVAFLKKVRKGRGIGKVKDRSEQFVGDRLVARISDFLG